MLVVHRIELVLLHLYEKMRKFEGGDTLRFEQARNSTDEIVDVWHMGKHVIRYQQVCALAGACEAARKFDAKKLRNDFESLRDGCRRGAASWFHAIAGNVARLH